MCYGRFSHGSFMLGMDRLLKDMLIWALPAAGGTLLELQ